MQNGFEAYENDGTRELPQRVYQVRVVTVLDPQVFWLELVRKSSLDPYQDDWSARKPAILQAGLLNIFPTEFDSVEPFLELQWSASKAWMPVAVTTLRRLLEQADSVYFRPRKDFTEEFSFIENIKCFFGQLYVSKDGVLEDVSKILTERCLAYKSSSRTKRYEESNTMFLQRNPLEIEEARRDILAHHAETRRKETETRKRAEDEIQISVNTVRSEVNQIKKSLPSYLKQRLREEGRCSQREVDAALRDMDRVLEECVRDVAGERFGESFRARSVPARGAERRVEPVRQAEPVRQVELGALQSTLAAYKKAIQQKCPKVAALTEKKKESPRPARAVSYVPAGITLDSITSKQLKSSTDTPQVSRVTPPSLPEPPAKKTTQIVHHFKANPVETEVMRLFTSESKWADSCDSEICVESTSPAVDEEDNLTELDFKLIPKNTKKVDGDSNSRSAMSDIITRYKQTRQGSNKIASKDRVEHVIKNTEDAETVTHNLDVNHEEQTENNRIGFIVKESQKCADNSGVAVNKGYRKHGNADSSCSTSSESRSSSGDPVSNNNGTQNRNVPEYKKVCKKKAKHGRDAEDEEGPRRRRDFTSSSGRDDCKIYKRHLKRSSSTKPFKLEESFVDPEKGFAELMNTTDYCLIDGSKPSQNRFTTSIKASDSKDTNNKQGAASSNILKSNDHILTDGTVRRLTEIQPVSPEVDTFFKGFKKSNIVKRSTNSFIMCEDLEKSLDSDRTSIFDGSPDSTHSADAKHHREQEPPIKPRMSFDIIKKFSRLNKSKSLEVGNDVSEGDTASASTMTDESMSRTGPNIDKHEVVECEPDTTTEVKESKSYNIILQVLKRKRDRLAAINAGNTARGAAEYSGIDAMGESLKRVENQHVSNVCPKSPSDENVVSVITNDDKQNTSVSKQFGGDENVGFTNVIFVGESEKESTTVDDVMVDETKIHPDDKSNSNPDNQSFTKIENITNKEDTVTMDGESETKIQLNANVEDELEIKTDESICGSEPRLQSDEDPELVEDSDSPSNSNSHDCSASSFSSSSAWKAKGLGMLARRDSVKSSSLLSDKSYYSSPAVEVNKSGKARQSKVLKEYSFDGNRRCREAIAEEGGAIADSKSAKENGRVAFNSGASADFEEAFIQDDYVQFSKEYNNNECSQLESGLIESILTPKVVIHSKSGDVCSPWRELTSTMFSKAILANLEKMRVKVPRKIQSSVWPTVSRGGSTLVVGPAGSGKGLSILAPVCSQLSRMILNKTSESSGPVVLILCPDIKTARNVNAICTSLLDGCTTNQGKSFSVLRIDDCDNSQNVWSFFKPCEVLISTPRCLSAYMKYEVNILNFDRVEYLIMENLDTLDERFSHETDSIVDLVKKVANEQGRTDLKTYATSKVWCDMLKRIAEDSYNPTLVISALQECVFYSGMQLQVRFAVSQSKINLLREILQQSGLSLKRSVVVCESDAEVSDVVEALKSDSHMVLKADTSMTLDVLNEVRLSWRNCKIVGNMILVCCDENLHFLDIVNANWLIHFSLPKTFTKFNLRFSTMANNYPNLYAEDSQKLQKLTVDIFVDEKNSLQLPKIVDFIKRYRMEVPASIEKVLRDILNLKDFKKADSFVPLCDRLMGFGDCPNKWNCVERHSIVEARDKPAHWIPRVGTVKCKVVLVHHSGLFSTRLLEHTDPEGVVTTVQQRNLRISMEMAAYFSCEPNRRFHGVAKLGDLCAVKIDRSYERCQVIKIIPSHSKKHSNVVLLNLLEEESYVWKNAHDLLFLPKHLKEMQSAVVRVRMVGLKPAGGKEYWSTTSVQKLRSKFGAGDGIVLKGKIVLGIGNTLWLENVQICKRLESLRLDAVRCNLKQYLLSEFAVENPSHLANLYRLCETYNFELPLYAPPRKHSAYRQKLPEVQWAHLNEDRYTDVYFSSGVDPDCFFVRIVSHQKTLDDMQNEIQTYVEDMKSKLVDLPHVSGDMIDGGFYSLAKYEDDGRYYRARVDEIVADSNLPITNLTPVSGDNVTYKCFFVDHGDWKIVKLNEMFPINAKFISRMPFQAIECGVFGLKPLENGWKDRDIDFLYDLSFEGDTDTLKVLTAKYYAKSSAKITTGNKYGILLVDKESRKTFADSFISDNMGAPIENEVILMNRDSDNLEKYLSLPEECDPEDVEDVGPVAPIPDFILQQALTPYAGPDRPIDNVDKLTEWNRMFTEFDDSDDNAWDCTFDADELEEFKRCHNLPRMPRLCETDESSDKEGKRDSPKSVDDFVMVYNTEKIPTVSSLAESRLREIPTKPGHMTPQVLWYQNEKSVTVKILLPDVNIYECKINVKSLYFETYTNDNIYKVDLELYAGVVPEKCSHVSKGSYVFLRLCKMTRIEWDFLTVNKEKRIVYDHDFVYIDEDDSDMEEEQNRMKEGIKARAGELIYDDGDDREGGADDDILDNLPFIDTDPINRELMRQLHVEESDDDLID